MKKFIIVLLVVLFVLTCFSGCDKFKKSLEQTQEPIPTNGIVVTPEPVFETAEVEEAIEETIMNNIQ